MYTAARYFGEMARLQAVQGDFAIIFAPTLGLWPLKIPVAGLLAKALCWAICFLRVYISIAAVTASGGSALTAGHFGKTERRPACRSELARDGGQR